MIERVKALCLALYAFFKHPDDRQLDLSVGAKLKFVLLLMAIELLFTLVVVLPLGDGIDLIHKIKEDRFDYSWTMLYLLFGMVFLGPLVEEFIFRYILRYKGLSAKLLSRSAWDKVFPFLVYGLSIGFGLVHLNNYAHEDLIVKLLSPLIVLSQLVGGFIIVFIRVRLSFLWALFYHCLWNFIFVIAVPFFNDQFSAPLQSSDAHYTLTITEKSFFDKDKGQRLHIDSSSQQLHLLEVQQYSLQHLLDTLYSKDAFYVDDILIDLQLESPAGISKQEFLNLLRQHYTLHK